MFSRNIVMMNNNLITRSTYCDKDDLQLFVNSLPEPFSFLNIKPVQSLSGKSWIFHVDHNGIMLGFLFSGSLQLYGLKTSAARFHEHLSAKLRRMGFKPSKADFDLWYRDKGDHYEYVATYVDDILAFSRDPMKIINEIQDDYVLKGIGTPEYYLGGDFHSTKDLNNMQEVGHDEQVKHLTHHWLKHGIKTAFSAQTYIENSLKKLEDMMGKQFSTYNTPMAESAHPELDDSPLLDTTDHSKF